MLSKKPIGTKKTGLANAEDGPFRCGHCGWFKNPHYCGHPDVLEDPEVPQEKTNAGSLAVVYPDQCCYYYRPIEPIVDVPFEKLGL